MIKQYRKKPVVIEAVQYDGDNLNEIYKFTNYQVRIGNRIDSPLFVLTLEGAMEAKQGDFIIKGVNGEFYPCKPDIFEKTYELVESEATK